jgi:hypothetical protein
MIDSILTDHARREAIRPQRIAAQNDKAPRGKLQAKSNMFATK